MGSSLKDKLTGNCESCEERRQAIIDAWKATKKRIQEAYDKQKRPK